ncbi:Mitochondrial Ribosomal Protein, Large [Aphelenchoides fujianensis]|nr:Mitochondrial Ribosomal Protein, Large [Aphelenchoides fujianensis]
MFSVARLKPAAVCRPLCRSFAAAAASPQGVPLADGPSSSIPSAERSISPQIEELVNRIAGLSLLEVADLNYALKKKLNIPDQPLFAAAAAVAPAAAPSAAEAAPEEDVPKKTSFAVKLTKFDETKKIALIKEIRSAIAGLNLVQAKKFVESAPVEVKADLGKNEADELKAVLEKVGATCEVV